VIGPPTKDVIRPSRVSSLAKPWICWLSPGGLGYRRRLLAPALTPESNEPRT